MYYFFKIAKKEFDDYMRSRIVAFVLVIFFIVFICSEYNTYISSQNPQVIVTHGNGWGLPLVFEYGSLVAIVLGLSSMYDEFGTRAINTLIVKPIYRDTILNGKLLGSLGLAFCIFLFTTLISIALNFTLYGALFVSNFTVFLNVLPVIFLLYLFCFMIFYLLTVLMFVVFRNTSISLFLAFLSWVFIYMIVPGMTFSAYISLLLPDSMSFVSALISGFSPSTIAFNVMRDSTGLLDAFNADSFEFIKLLLFIIILLPLCYIAFLRRDIQ